MFMLKDIAQHIVIHPGDVRANWTFDSVSVENGVHQIVMVPVAGMQLLMEDLFGEHTSYKIIARSECIEEAVEDAWHKATFRQHSIATVAKARYGL